LRLSISKDRKAKLDATKREPGRNGDMTANHESEEIWGKALSEGASVRS